MIIYIHFVVYLIILLKGTSRKKYIFSFYLLTNGVMPKTVQVPKNKILEKSIQQMYEESKNGELNAVVFCYLILIVRNCSKYFCLTSYFVCNEFLKSLF